MADFFDFAARVLATPMPRRRAFRLLGGALVAAFVGVAPADAQQTCPSPKFWCGNGAANRVCCNAGTCCAKMGNAAACCTKGQCVCSNGTCASSTGGVCPKNCTVCT